VRAITASVAAAVVVLAAAAPASAAGGPAPQFGVNVVAEHVKGGQISFTPPGGSARPLSGPTAIPLGSIVDTTHGTVRIINATNASGATQSAEFTGGVIRVSLPAAPAGELKVSLVDPPCGLAHAAFAQHGESKHVSTKDGDKSLVEADGGSARSKNKLGVKLSADVRRAGEVMWTTTDTCVGGQIMTTIADKFGEVGTTGAHQVPVKVRALGPGDQIAYECGAAPPASEAYCALVRTHKRTPAFALTLVTRHRGGKRPPYVLDLSPPNNFPDSKVRLPLRPVSGGFGRSDVDCGADQGPGEYEATWSVNGSILAVIDVDVPLGMDDTGVVNVPCAARPFGPWVPADLMQQVTAGPVVVHFTSRLGAFSDATTQSIATNVANWAEQALMFDTEKLGMPVAPASDGPLEVYLEESTVLNTFHVFQVPKFSVPDEDGNPSWPLGEPGPAYLVLNPTLAFAGNPFYIYFGVFEALADETVGELYAGSGWVALASAASWAAGFNNMESPSSEIGVPYLDSPIDSRTNTYDDWRLFEYLAEQYGPGVVAEIMYLDAVALRPNPRTSPLAQVLASVLAEHGTTLPAALAGYALVDLSDTWNPDTSNRTWVGGGGVSAKGPNSAVTLATAGDGFAAQTFAVQPLAIDYIYVDVPPKSQQPCANEILTVDVTVPAGGSAPGGATMTQGVGGTVPASSPAPGTSQVQVPVDGCTGVTLRVPFVNGTTGGAPVTFSATGVLATASPG